VKPDDLSALDAANAGQLRDMFLNHGCRSFEPAQVRFNLADWLMVPHG
jgi:hypothetical protein